MGAQMSRTENAARVAMGAPDGYHGAFAYGMTTLVKLAFAAAALALTVLVAATLL